MTPKPFTFSLAPSAFDASRLPADARDVASERFQVAVATYFEEQLGRDGGRVTVSFNDNLITVSWTPALGAEGPLDYGVELLRQGDYHSAIPLMEELLRVDPDDPRVLFNLGMAYSDTGRLADATALLEKLVRVDPGRAAGYVALGVAHQRAKRPAEATQALQRAIELDASDGYAHRNLAAVLGSEGNLTEAERLFRRATELLPTDQQSAAGLARALLAAGRTDEADAALRMAIELAPESALAEALRSDRSEIAHRGFREHGLRPDAMAYCMSAMDLFDSLPPKEMQAITFEIAALGRQGLDVGDTDRKYSLKAIPNKRFSGLQLVVMMYVGLKRIDPKLDSGFDLKAECGAALSLRGTATER